MYDYESFISMPKYVLVDKFWNVSQKNKEVVVNVAIGKWIEC